jgi:glucose-1-phosphate thymidylyltransferase
MIGVVLAGGSGERLRPLTKEKPKAFLKLAGRYLFEYSLDELREAGIDNIIVIVPPKWDKGLPINVPENVEVINQEVEGSLESAFKVAFEKIKEMGSFKEVVFTFVGFLSAPKGMVKSTLEFYSNSSYPAVITSVPVISGLETYGFVRVKGDKVEEFLPPFAKKRKEVGYVFGGVLVGNIEVLKMLSQKNYYLALGNLAAKGLLGTIIWHGEWIEIGYPWDFLETFDIVKRLLTPHIDYDAVISRDAIIEGEVIIESGAKVLSGAIIEGPTYIGKGAVIGRNSIIISSIIESGVRIGDMAKVERSIVMENSVVGDHSLVAYSILGEGSRTEPYSLTEVGEPERVPERLRDYVKFTRRPLNLGAVIAPKSTLRSFSKTKPGEVVE